jgi:acyl carrier protein
MQERFESLRDIMAMIFGIDKERITPQSAQADITEWDSVGHLNLMLSLEDAFETRLNVDDIPQLVSVEEILRHLEAVCRSR